MKTTFNKSLEKMVSSVGLFKKLNKGLGLFYCDCDWLL